MVTDLHFRAATARNALVVIAVVVAGAAFYWLGGILTPLALAIFLMVMIDAFARNLRERLHFAPAAALPLAILFSILFLALTAFVVADNASAFAAELIGYGPRLNGLIAKAASAFGVAVPPTLDQLMRNLNPENYLGVVADSLKGFATTAVLVLIYLGFLLASRQAFERKSHALFPSDEDRRNAAQMFQRIREGIQRYLWIQTVTCGMIALASWAIMAAIQLDNALFWAFVIFIVGFIPIIGGAIGILVPPIFALVQFDGWMQAVILLAGLQIVNFFVGNIVYPRLQGRSLNIDPVVVLLSLAFWGGIWGFPGMFLSTPLTVTAMVILAQFQSSHWVAVLLSGDGDPFGGEAVEAQAAAEAAQAAPPAKAPGRQVAAAAVK
jgi:predicted PurR-regulated permease PerM